MSVGRGKAKCRVDERDECISKGLGAVDPGIIPRPVRSKLPWGILIVAASLDDGVYNSTDHSHDGQKDQIHKPANRVRMIKS